MNNFDPPPVGAGAVTYPALTFDPDEFMVYVADHDVDDVQATQLLTAIWEIAVAFVDLRLGIHPLQTAVDQLSEAASGGPDGGRDVLGCAGLFSVIAKQHHARTPRGEPATKEDS